MTDELREGDKPEPALIAWLEERRDNARRIGATKKGADRDGWKEDAGYFDRAIAALRASRSGEGALTAELLEDLKCQYGMVGTRDVDIAAWNAKLDRAIAALRGSGEGAEPITSPEFARIMKGGSGEGSDDFERGRQQGMKQERALWNLAASSQEIDREGEAPQPDALREALTDVRHELSVIASYDHADEPLGVRLRARSAALRWAESTERAAEVPQGDRSPEFLAWWHETGRDVVPWSPGDVDAAEIGFEAGRALAAPVPQGGALTDEQIVALAYRIGGFEGCKVFAESEMIAFARAILATLPTSERAPRPSSNQTERAGKSPEAVVGGLTLREAWEAFKRGLTRDGIESDTKALFARMDRCIESLQSTPAASGNDATARSDKKEHSGVGVEGSEVQELRKALIEARATIESSARIWNFGGLVLAKIDAALSKHSKGET